MLNRKIMENSVVEALKFQELCLRMGYDDLYEKDKKYMSAITKPTAVQKYAWVGINPEVGAFTLKELYDKAVLTIPYREYEMTAEQFTKGGIRPHLHILIKVSANARKNHIIARLAKVFDIAEQSVQVRISHNLSLVSQWQKYLKGEKSECKLEDVEKDREYRENNNIPHIYNAKLPSSSCSPAS